MFDIKESTVRDLSTADSYIRGLSYYLEGRVYCADAKIESLGTVKKTFINAEVKSSSNIGKNYNVRVVFSTKSSSIHSTCNCPIYSNLHNKGTICKHIVAVLLKYCKEKDELLKNKNFKIHNNLLYQVKNNLLLSKKNTKKIPLNLSFKLEVQRGYNSSMSLQLKVGEQKLYVVKNMKEFLKSILYKQEMDFGKNFTYNPDVHIFKKEDKGLLDILTDVYETDRTAETLVKFGERASRFLKGKNAHLTENNLRNFFQKLGDRSFDFVLNEKSFIDVAIINDDFPLEFKLESKDKKIILSQTSTLPIAITDSGRYFFYNNYIYIPSKEQVKLYRPFFNTFIKEGKNSLSFYEEENMDIGSYIIPSLKRISEKVIIDKNIEEKFYQEPVKTIIYLDKEEDTITATVLFQYGDIQINALKESEKEKTGKVLIRDIEVESQIINNLQAFGFQKGEYSFKLEEEEKIVAFMIDDKDKLQENCDIYYSDSFKDMKLYTGKSYKSTVRLNEEDLLEFSFTIDGIDKKELKNIFDALKQKKKYYKLKKGGFVPLNSDKLKQISTMIDYLNINTADLEKNKVILSKYNAAYIDSTLRDNDLNFVEKNKNFRDLVNNIKDIGEIDYSIPSNLENIMRDYQKFGFKWFKTLASCGFGGILSDEMGLGKTLQTISFIKSEVDSNEDKLPSLVVCPTSLVYNWEDELKKFQPDLKSLVISGSKNEREDQLKYIPEADVVITSYSLIRRDIDEYENIKFRYCFLDEAQNIKNPESLNAKTVKSIRAKGYFALTGTPIENSLTELWSIFDFIMPGYLLNHRKFNKKYEIPITKNGDKRALLELNKHVKPFILRRLKKDVVKELPPKIEHNMVIDMTEDQKRIYAAFLQQAKEEVDDEIREKGFNKSKIKILSILTRLRQICCDPSTFIENYDGTSGKMDALMNIVENNIGEGHKILLFSQFTSVLKNIATKLEKENIDYMYLDGSTKAEDRGSLVKEFNSSDIPIFLISLKAGGTGLNLTSADIVIHFDPWWNPAVEDQASDRAHRIGQKKTVEIIKLIARGTIEEKIHNIQRKKKEIIENVLDENSNENVLISNMSEDELKDLFT